MSSAFGKREIVLKEDGSLDDNEYTSWKNNSESIFFKGTGLSARVTYTAKGILTGFDSNDSGVEVIPQAHQKKDFMASFLSTGRSSEIITVESSVTSLMPEVKTQIAVIGTSASTEFDFYHPKRERLSEVFDQLFSNGYKYVVFGNQNIPDLSLKLIDEPKLAACFMVDGIHKWKSFAIPASIWPRLRKKLLSKDLNFYAAFEKAVKESNMTVKYLKES